MDGSPMCRNKRTDSKTILSKKKSLHIKMIHQVTQLQMQSIDQENNYYFISSHKMYYYVQIYIQNNTFDSNCSRGLLQAWAFTFMVIIKTHIHVYIQST